MKKEKTFQVISPVDGQVYLERSYASSGDMDQTLDAAVAAQRDWRKRPVDERAAICRKAVAYMLDHTADIAKELTWQMGRPICFTPFEISKGFKERAYYMIDIAEEALRELEIERSDSFRRFIRREPLGVVLVLAPWNYPYLTSVNSVIPAMMAGNAVILKHAQQTPLCAERYAKAFEQAGLPQGVFQYLHLTHRQVSLLIKDQRVDHVAFTGSVEGGEAVQKAIGKRFKVAGLELGGKDPAYVRADAELGSAVNNLVEGAFFNSGQSCCGIERIYVADQCYDKFVEQFVEQTRQYVLGNPLDEQTTLGPMVRTSAADFARQQVSEAIRQGAKALIDPVEFPKNKKVTPYMAPQVLTDVDHSMRVMTEETFGPVVGIMRVKGDEEALQLMNDSKYGLTASIWTEDPEAALRLGDSVETGTCYMNRCDYLDPALAWTGVKYSGRGCTLSKLGYESLTRPKSFHFRLNG